MVPLSNELNLKKPFELLAHEALLSTYHTASRLRRKASEFLSPFGVTDVQFNVLMLLEHQSGPDDGLSQARLGGMMLVNRANITTLVDRMEQAGLVVRTAQAGDRRRKIIKLTAQGMKMLARIEPLYIKEVHRIMAALDEAEQTRLIKLLESIRANVAG